MKKLNKFFFDEESISLSDGLWFYGVIIFVVTYTALIIFGG